MVFSAKRAGTVRRGIGLSILLAAIVGCSGPERREADIEAIYGRSAREIGSKRNPVLVIPGILGSKLQHAPTGESVWGAFVFGAVDADTKRGRQITAHPMGEGEHLRDLRDDVVPHDVLDNFAFDVGLVRGLRIGAYVDILKTLGAGGYRDQSLGDSGAVDYGGLHYTCFQFPYDWRRDISEQAVVLHELIIASREIAQAGEGLAEPPKVDVVAHSMGGMVLRYYLMYGPNPLPRDGSLPELTWEGAENVEVAVQIGTPNMGSPLALRQLVEGINIGPIFPEFRPALIGTMPAVYQLMNRNEARSAVDKETGEALDLYDVQTWIDHGWGLADPGEDDVLRDMLPDVGDPERRREIAIDHLEKCLAISEQLHRALDVPAPLPENLEFYLFAGDAIPSIQSFDAHDDGRLTVRTKAPGDDTVLRSSALGDQRSEMNWEPRLRTSIEFSGVHFLPENHLGLTKSNTFQDQILYLLLERPRTWMN